MWKSKYFISTYEVKVKSVVQGELKMSSQELDDIYNEEAYYRKREKLF